MATEKNPQLTFKLSRVEDLSPEERAKVTGLPSDMKEGMVIKEYASGSFVQLRRYLPQDNLVTSEISKTLTEEKRSIISAFIDRSL
ncbi:hypothetical protein A3A67_00760 [Candidatus Peribacteria bacterium RIFCSPLOWO2_01_FULL_51_18]|nr:hypothetical protein [Candidatus Woesearchaeota archaeon]OGJ65022.1 MAG: hypothetical protein A3A67_00760 [Candidatus Peribacteria bacterium RIFCSPLOWO2_01_FULL_51_18]HLD78940.1 hypothetical protein [Candidatus Nanoarchaeia archaeon]